MTFIAAAQQLAGTPDPCRPTQPSDGLAMGDDDGRAYHDERARAEFLLADRTDSPSVAERHRDLARLHIERRARTVTTVRIPRALPTRAAPILRTDKES